MVCGESFTEMLLNQLEIRRRDRDPAEEAGVQADVFQFGGSGGIGVQAVFDPPPLRFARRRPARSSGQTVSCSITNASR